MYVSGKGSEVLGMVGTHISGQKYNFMHFERHYIFSRKLEKNLGFNSKIELRLGYPKHRYFLFGQSLIIHLRNLLTHTL